MKTVVGGFFFFAFFGGVSLLSAFWAVVTFTRGEYLTVVVSLGFGVVFFGLVASLILIFSGRVTTRAEFDAEGTTFRLDRTVDVLFQGSAVGGIIAMVSYAIFAPFGQVDIPMPHGGLGQSYFVVICAVGALRSVWALRLMFARGGVSYLRLTPNGFELGQGLSPVDGDWDDVDEVADRAPRRSRPARSTIVMVMSDGRVRTLAADSYTPGGHALRQLVRFYWQHPEHRAELTDGRALERLRNEVFDMDS